MNLNKNWTLNGKSDGGVSSGLGFCISWQRGSISENGRNGAFLVEVLEACQHQLKYHQSGQLSCSENAIALEAINKALEALNSRIERRTSAGVYGTHKPDNYEN